MHITHVCPYLASSMPCRKTYHFNSFVGLPNSLSVGIASTGHRYSQSLSFPIILAVPLGHSFKALGFKQRKTLQNLGICCIPRIRSNAFSYVSFKLLHPVCEVFSAISLVKKQVNCSDNINMGKKLR